MRVPLKQFFKEPYVNLNSLPETELYNEYPRFFCGIETCLIPGERWIRCPCGEMCESSCHQLPNCNVPIHALRSFVAAVGEYNFVKYHFRTGTLAGEDLVFVLGE